MTRKALNFSVLDQEPITRRVVAATALFSAAYVQVDSRARVAIAEGRASRCAGLTKGRHAIVAVEVVANVRAPARIAREWERLASVGGEVEGWLDGRCRRAARIGHNLAEVGQLVWALGWNAVRRAAPYPIVDTDCRRRPLQSWRAGRW